MHKILQYMMRFMPLLFWLLVIIVSILMLIELQPKTNGIPYIDKLEHAFVFIALTMTGCLAYAQKKPWIYAGLIALGALYEVLQGHFTVTRQASIYDWLADVVGILLAIGIMAATRRFIKQNKLLAQ
jgi:VanZ family protein